CIADTCKELLEYQGYKVTSTTSSLEALEIFKATPEEFDLVFTDQTMPEMSGAELATKLLKIRLDIPIVLCSGFSAKVSEEDAKEIGIREFCLKPMDMKQLATVARRVLDESGNRR
ncbi:MAG: response regulator, partial [Desulfuromonadales bacterium]|nr:response regulator [Desulfuromonadales bacterium]